MSSRRDRLTLLYPFRRGDTILASVEAATTTKVVLYVRVTYKNGDPDTLVFPITHPSGDGSHQHFESELLLHDGVVEEVCHLASAGILRGEFFVETCRRWGDAHFNLCYGYVSPDHSVPLGHREAQDSVGRSYRRDKKYTAGASITGLVDLTPAVDNPLEIESLYVIVGAVKATPATGAIQKINSAGAVLAYFARDGSIAATEVLAIPGLGKLQDSAAATVMMTDSTLPVTIHNPDSLRIQLVTMVEPEVFNIRLRALIYGPEDPTITLAASLTESVE